MTSIELKAYQDFMKQFRETKPQVQRLGQAFCDHFKLDKSTQLKSVVEELYQLDGFKAIACINHTFTFN